jgi:hypothetical protein
MGRARALSIGPGIDPLHFHGTVHSVFGRALNIGLDSGRLAALVATELPNAPATIRVDPGGRAFTEFAVPGETAACRAGILRFGGGLTVDLRSAQSWLAEAPDGRPNKAAWQSLYNITTRTTMAGELKQWPGLRICLHPENFGDMPPGRLIATLDPLVGLGPGLTPAGDDFIAGLAAALYWSGSGSLLAPHLPGWAARTTQVSRWLILDSSAGQINQPVCDLAQALASDGAAPAADAVLKLGHLSGTAMILGLLAGYGFAWPDLAADRGAAA